MSHEWICMYDVRMYDGYLQNIIMKNIPLSIHGSYTTHMNVYI